MKEIKEYIERFVKLLPLNSSISIPEAEKRASEFLVVMAQITEYAHLLAEEKIRFTTIESATMSEELSKSDSSTVTAAKIKVKGSAPHVKAREDLEKIESDLEYLKSYYKIFDHAHLFYRQRANGGSF